MTQAIHVARYLIHLTTPVEDEDTDVLSHMQLQKLLYYVQGWHLASSGGVLFPERIGAWMHGPVVDALYPIFKPFRLAVPANEGAESVPLTEREKAFVKDVWERYKNFSGSALRNMTHREAPWVEARARCDPDDRYSSAEITPEAMRAFFFPRYVELMRRSDARIELAKWQASATAIAAGRVRNAKDIRRELQNRRAGTDPS